MVDSAPPKRTEVRAALPCFMPCALQVQPGATPIEISQNSQNHQITEPHYIYRWGGLFRPYTDVVVLWVSSNPMAACSSHAGTMTRNTSQQDGECFFCCLDAPSTRPFSLQRNHSKGKRPTVNRQAEGSSQVPSPPFLLK